LPTKPVENWDAFRDDWLAALDCFFTEVETWAKKQDWATLRSAKTITESGLGSYTTSRLLVHLLEGRLVFDPLARFVYGASGLIDWYVMPSYDSLSLVLTLDGWRLHTVRSNGTTVPWSEEVFVNTARELVKKA
jgi:hypothetical protein